MPKSMEENTDLSEINRYDLMNHKIQLSTFELDTWNLKYEAELENIRCENNKCLERIEEKVHFDEQMIQLYESCSDNLESSHRFLSIIYDGADDSKKYFLLRHANAQSEINEATENLHKRYEDILEKQMSLKYVQEKYEAKEEYEKLQNDLQNLNQAITIRENEIKRRNKEQYLLTKHFIINMIKGSADMNRIKIMIEQVDVDIVGLEKVLEGLDLNVKQLKFNLTPVKIKHFQLSPIILGNLRENQIMKNINIGGSIDTQNEKKAFTQIKKPKIDHENEKTYSTQIKTVAPIEKSNKGIFRKPFKVIVSNEILPKCDKFIESSDKISPAIEYSQKNIDASYKKNSLNNNKKRVIINNDISVDQNKIMKIAEDVVNNEYVEKNNSITEDVISISESTSESESDEKVENKDISEKKQNVDDQYLVEKDEENNSEIMELDNTSNDSSAETITENKLKNKNAKDDTNEEEPTDSDSINSDLQIDGMPSENASVDFSDINISDNDFQLVTDNLSDYNQMESNFFNTSFTDNKKKKKDSFFNF